MQRLKSALASEGPVTPPLPLRTQPGKTVLHGEPSGE
jgi:metallo-beta-lactamase family protein